MLNKSINLSGFLSDNQSKIDKDLQKYANCFCDRRINPLTREKKREICRESPAIVFKLFYFEKITIVFLCPKIRTTKKSCRQLEKLTWWSGRQPGQQSLFCVL